MTIKGMPHAGDESTYRTRGARWLAVIFPLVLAFVAVVGVGEWLLSRKRPLEIPVNNEPYPYVMFQAPSGVTWRSTEPSPSSRTGEYAIEYTTRDGFRADAPGYDLPKAKPDGQVRVAMIGGSTVRVGTTFDVSLAGSLRTKLREAYPDVDFEVINAGVISAISRQQLILLITTVVDYQPDMLVVYDGINDSGQMLYYEDRPNFPYNYRAVEAAWWEYVEGRSESLWKLLPHRSAILERLFPQRFGKRSVLNPVPAERLVDDPALRRTYADAHVDNWKKIWKVATAFGIRPLFVLQPTSLYPEFAAGRLDAERVPVLYANYLIYEEMRRTTREFVGRNAGVRRLDLADMLPSDAFYDGAHVYDDVNAQIAARIAEFMASDVEALAGAGSQEQ